jgi:hypothetical protein
METAQPPTETENLIADTLALPLDAKAYLLSRQLKTLFPDKSIVQGEEYSFDLDEFTADGHATAVLRPDIFSQLLVSFRGLGEGLGEATANAWYEVAWQGYTLQVVLVSWYMEGCKYEHYWIIAETEAIAKEFYLRVCEWDAEVRGEVLVFDNGGWYKDETLYHAIKNATFANLILPPRLKQEIQDDFAQFFASREIYERYRIPWKRGVLLIGPPGNGKTHTVKALLNWLDAPCLYVKSFKSRYQTDQNNIHAVFRRARQTTPCILVMEDLDSLINDRNRSFFLNELDGFAANTGIVVLATTNHPERLDPALVNRPSRFDRKYHFELPAEEERYAYICAWNDAVELELQIPGNAIAATVTATEGFSFAYLKELFLSAMMRWISNPQKAPMPVVIAEQCTLLREQMHAMNEALPPETDPDEEE